MRIYYAGFEEEFDDHLEAVRTKRRAIVRREAWRDPPPNIFVKCRGYRVVGYGLCGPWSCVRRNGVVRERFFGTPVPPPKPKHRKGKPSRILYISQPMFPHP